MQFVELLNALKQDSEMRLTLKTLITILDNYEAMESELAVYDDNIADVREIAVKLEKKASDLMQQVQSLEQDKKALTQFIIDNVTDENKLNEIFR